MSKTEPCIKKSEAKPSHKHPIGYKCDICILKRFQIKKTNENEIYYIFPKCGIFSTFCRGKNIQQKERIL